MNAHSIYERTAWDHGFMPIPRALGAVRVLRHEWAPDRRAEMVHPLQYEGGPSRRPMLHTTHRQMANVLSPQS